MARQKRLSRLIQAYDKNRGCKPKLRLLTKTQRGELESFIASYRQTPPIDRPSLEAASAGIKEAFGWPSLTPQTVRRWLENGIN